MLEPGKGGSVSPRRQRKAFLKIKASPETPAELLETMNRQVMEAPRAGHGESGAFFFPFHVSSCLEDTTV